MNYLLPGMESKAKVALLLSVTKIDSERKLHGIYNHLVNGVGIGAAAALAELPQPKLSEAIATLNRVAEAFEKYHEIKLHE